MSKNKTNLPSEAKALLEKWLDNHLQKPYPNPQEKSTLAEETGLRTKQIESYLEKSRKKRGLSRNHRLPDRALSVLERWINGHIDNAYPSEEEKDGLAEESGLTKTQVQSWFEKARATRGLQKKRGQSAGAAAAKTITKKAKVENINGEKILVSHSVQEVQALTDYLPPPDLPPLLPPAAPLEIMEDDFLGFMEV